MCVCVCVFVCVCVCNVYLFTLQVTFERHTIDDETGVEKTKLVRKTLFQRNNPYPQKKVMTFNRLYQDFNFNVSYGTVDFLSEQQAK